MKTIVIDATNAILGRLASYAAKQALRGEEVVIINCTQALITGNRRNIIGTYLSMRQKGGSAMNGPNFPSNPSRIVKRTVRGMLPYKQGRGLAALQRVKCYDQVHVVKDAKPIKLKHTTDAKTTTLRELCTEL